jgi:hypothetical protein
MNPQSAGTILIDVLLVKFVMVQQLRKPSCFAGFGVKGIDTRTGFHPERIGVIHSDKPYIVSRSFRVQTSRIVIVVVIMGENASCGVELVEPSARCNPDLASAVLCDPIHGTTQAGRDLRIVLVFGKFFGGGIKPVEALVYSNP